MSLEDVLDGKEPEVVEQEAEKVEEEEAQSQEDEPVAETEPAPEVETTDEPEPTGVKETEPPSVETTKEVPLAAMLDERDKRKALQAELEALKAEKEKDQKEKVDFWENPEAAIQEAVSKVEQDFQQKLVAGRLELSMQIAKTYHDDYDAGLEAFKAAAEENPALVDQALQSEHPGEYIYTTGKQFADLDAMGGDLNAMREQIRNEERAKLMAEMKGKEQKLASVPTPLTDESSAMAPREKVEGGPTPLESIIRSD
jgi:hypothetical protein